MKLKDLPLSSQVFEDVILGRGLYVDKTAYLHRMVTTGVVEPGQGFCPKFFLSRPRRFGKSMTVSTLKAIFEGKRDLFNGLVLGNTDYGFDVHPILKLDFSALGKTPADLKHSLLSFLDDVAQKHEINLTGKTLISEKTERILTGLNQKWVILIDEYDAPILDALKENDEAIRRQKCENIIEILREFYLPLKAADANLRLVFITGVSKFSQVSVFSGLNNLLDISMDKDYAGLCGYTQEELESCFKPYIARLAEAQELSLPQTLEKLKYYYNGYQFSPDTTLKVYNPFSVLHSFEHQRFETRWFQSGTPSFLINWIRRERYPIDAMEGQRVSDRAFSARDPHQMDLIGMMIQTGYLTIKSFDKHSQRYLLDYPNYEVKEGFLNGLLESFDQLPPVMLENRLDDWKEWVEVGNWTVFFKEFNRMLAGVPYHLHMPKEAYYHSIFHCVIALVGLRIQSELATSRGRIDTFIETQDSYWIFEFKYAENEADYDTQLDNAFSQPKKKGYLDRFDASKPLCVMGVVFDGSLKQVVKWGEDAMPKEGSH